MWSMGVPGAIRETPSTFHKDRTTSVLFFQWPRTYAHERLITHFIHRIWSPFIMINQSLQLYHAQTVLSLHMATGALRMVNTWYAGGGFELFPWTSVNAFALSTGDLQEIQGVRFRVLRPYLRHPASTKGHLCKIRGGSDSIFFSLN